MASVAREVYVKTPLAEVWKAMTEVEKWPQWAAHMQSLVRLDPGPLRTGSRVRVKPRGMPGAIWVVTEFADLKSFTWTTKAPGIQLIGGHRIERHNEGTRATLFLESRGWLAAILWPALQVIFRRNTRVATQGLKAYCEAKDSRLGKGSDILDRRESQ